MHLPVRVALALVASALAGSAAAQSTPVNPNPMDSIRRLPGYRPAADTVPLLPRSRVAALPPRERARWGAYLARSDSLYARDTAAMNAELRAVGRGAMIRAPYTHDFSVKPFMTDAWFASDSARSLAEAILSFQAPDGGWSKHVDFTKHARQPGESYYAESDRWEWIATLDNDQTTEEMHFLARADRVRRDQRYEAAFRRGLDWLLEAQYPNGCWPQVYPLEGSYHDAATFNDDAIVNAIRLLNEVARGAHSFVPPERRAHAAAAVARGTRCILDAQVVVDGRRTIWAQQNDPITLAPTSARSYELTSLSARESVPVVDWLMSLPHPDARTVAAVHDAAAWFRANAIRGYAYPNSDVGLVARPGAGPLWARMSEIGTNRPIFANRDGRKLYDFARLTDRRHGYGWFTDGPAPMLAAYDRWAKAHPRTAH